jgi:hypothetical protein
MSDTLESTGNYLPKDLRITAQPDAVDKDKFKVVASGLKINESYVFQFQYVFENGSVSEWSPGYAIQTSNESSPGVPTGTIVPSTATGSIPVELPTFPAGARKVDVIVTNGIFGLGKVAYTFLAAGKATIAAPAGTYIVQLRATSISGVTSTVGTTHTITISDAGETVQDPTNPNGFSSKRILAGIEVSWAGTYANSTFTGFEAINIYAGNSASATPGTYEQVGVLTGNNVKNTIVVPLGTYVVYGQPVYIHAAAVNKSGAVGTIQANVTSQLLGPGKATDADINDGAVVISKLASDVLTVGNLKAGDINATSFIRAGTASSARVEISSAVVGSVLAGLHIYNSVGDPVLKAPLSGGLEITGKVTATSGSFTGDLYTSNNQFSVISGSVTALSGTIGGWIINESAFKSSAVAYPKIELDPVSPKFEIRQSASDSSESGIKVIKIDPIDGIRAGTTSNFKFRVDMDGNMTATDAIFSSGTFNGNITSSATISGGIITGAVVTTGSAGVFGAVRLNSSSYSLEVVNGDGTVTGQLYGFNSGNEVILRQGNTRESFGYPTNSAYLSLAPTTVSLGWTGSTGLSSKTLTLSYTGEAYFDGPVNSNSNGTLSLRQFRNTIASVNTPSGSGYYIGDIWIQY